MTQPLWPKRLREQGGAEAGSASLASLLEACSEAADPSEDVIRSAVRVALRSQPAETGLRARLQGWLEGFAATCARQLKVRRVLAAIALLGVVQLGLAFAAEHGWRRLGDVRIWSRSLRAAASPSFQAPLPALAPGGVPLPLPLALPGAPEAPAAEPLPPAPIVAAAPPAAQRECRKISLGARSTDWLAAHPDPLAAEASLVSHAIALLDTNPRSSLSALDDYHRSFPAGALRGEAALAELRAHLAIGDSRSALASLDRLATDRFASMGQSAAELRTSRLELMAGAGRCTEVLRSLDAEIAAAPSPRLQGRLLLVRASCRAASGDAAGSTRDLRQYLRMLPAGPRAAEVRRRVGGD